MMLNIICKVEVYKDSNRKYGNGKISDEKL